MALTAEKAMKRQNELLNSSSAARAAYEAYCGLCLAYAYGSQWADLNTIAQRSGHSLQQLRTIIDANRTDVRVTMNLIRGRITKLNSRLAPKAIRAQAVAASRAINDQVAALVADSRLQLHLKGVGALRKLKKMSLWRLVLGSAVIRRCMWNGPPVVARDPDGTPRRNARGRRATLPTVQHAWDVTPPYEYIRDPSAYSVDFEGEDCIGQEKPRSVAWLQRNFGIKPKELEETAKMGELLEFQRFLYRATGQTLDYGWQDSQVPAVMVGEWLHRDDESDVQGRWPWFSMTYRNTAGKTGEARGLKPLHFGPSPYHNLPMHHFWYEEELLCPWGKGVPALTIQAQDMGNLALTGLLRRLLAHSSTKYLIEQESLVDDISVALGTSPWRPIVYKRGFNKPDRLKSSPLDPAMMAIIDQCPDWLDRLLNMAPIQFGFAAGKHGEAGKAYEIRRDQADTPLNSINDDDELTLNELLTGSLFDLVRNEKVESLYELLSHEFTLEQLLALKNQDVGRTLVGIEVVPDSLRPKTPEEHRQETAFAIKMQMTDPVSARRSLLIRGGETIDEREARAYRQQLGEIQTILGGGYVAVALRQHHDMHMYTVGLETESMRWNHYTPQQQNDLMAHSWEHQQAKEMQLRLDQPQLAMTQETAATAEAPQEAAEPIAEPALAGGEMAQQLGAAGLPEAEPAIAV